MYKTEDVCCAPNVAFPEGCSPKNVAAQNDTTSAPAVSAAITAQAAQVAQGAQIQLVTPPVKTSELPEAGQIIPGLPLPGQTGPVKAVLSQAIPGLPTPGQTGPVQLVPSIVIRNQP